jgi:uncharacterized protein YndB with AHSA1/START domain
VDDLAVLERRDGRRQLRFVRRLPHPPERVWPALTEPDQVAAWFPTSIEGERAAGAALRFVFPHDEGPPFDGEMLVYDPPRHLEFRWAEDLLRFDLADDGDSTALTLRVTFDELGKAARDAAGWHVCLARLNALLAGDDDVPAWTDVQPLYVERFGPEASTVGPPRQS